jgi:glycosyltransferase involved in cell wall biosynthesis
MRIAIFTETFLPKVDGVTNTTCQLLDHLSARGHASIMFAPRGAPPRYADTTIVGLAGFSFPLYPELRLVPPVLSVTEQLVAFQPDLVLLINPCSLGLVGLRHARAMRLPVVASYQTDIPGYAVRYGLGLLRDPLWAYFRWLHNQADLNLCPSQYTQDQLAAHGFERLCVWGRGVDRQRFHPRHRDPRWRDRLTEGHPAAPLILYVGRLAPEKQVDWLRPVLDALPGARLAVVGDGPGRADLEACFAGTSTTFTGYLRGADLAHAYASADVFAFPSANETFGNVVLEAMASGLPVAVPRSGGPVDHVSHEVNGLLADPDDPADFCAQVARLATDPTLRRRLARGARAYAEAQSWNTILDRLLADLQKVIDEHAPRPARTGWNGALHERSIRQRQAPSRPNHKRMPSWLEGATGRNYGTTADPGHQ